jgi:putative heme-binding domain-containing protein
MKRLHVVLPLLFFALIARAADPFELKPGDHICVVGNTLPDRMQHFGWFETYLHSRFPDHKLVVRNLGYSGDEITTRLRSMDFGSPDQWLAGSAPIPQPKKLIANHIASSDRFQFANTHADVVFAFFGYNESYGGPAKLDAFKSSLGQYLKHLQGQKYNGKSPPRIVLFSPIAFEDHKSPNLPDGNEANSNLKLYTSAMADVAKANNVRFVDLFTPTVELYAQSGAAKLTINGVHLNDAGDNAVANVIVKDLFGGASKLAPSQTAALRTAVNDKNYYWYHRYRTTDGYSTYGERAFLKFVNGQSNYEVLQRELEILDIMTANRDEVVWAAANGKSIKPKDDNTPAFVPVISNKQGPEPGGLHRFLSGEEAISKMIIGKGLKINLFASEKEFPEIANPVQMAWDAKGRLWVAAWPTYPHWTPKQPMNDKLVILEDTDGDGKADKCTTFSDKLHNPTGFEFYNGGVLVAQAPDLMFLKDTNGDDKADVYERVLHGLDTADTHHTANSFVMDPGGAVYFQEGTFHHTQVETPYGPAQRCANAGVFRYEPRTQKFDVYVSFGFANPHGHVFDRWGQDIVVDGTGSDPYHAALFSGQVDFPNKHSRPPTVYRKRVRPCPGMEYLSSRHFPDDFQGNLLVGDVIQFQGILRYKIEDDGSSFAGKELEPIVRSTDPNFRPSDIKVGPDGAIYFMDWHNPIIGHMQHNLRDPSRDKTHGRVYRVTYEGRALNKPEKIGGESIEALLNLLKHPEDRVRYHARIELGGRTTGDVIAAAKKWRAALDSHSPDYEHHMLEALWLQQSHNVVDEDLLRRMLNSPEYRARAAATRVLCYWRDRVKDPLGLLKAKVNDASARVRLEAIRALSFFHGEEPLNIALESLAHPDDEYIRFTLSETLNTLERRTSGARIDRKNIAASLVQLLQKGRVPAERQGSLVETICKRGSAAELRYVWEQARQPEAYSKELRLRAIDWLIEAATARRAVPNVKTTETLQLLRASAATNMPLFQSMIRLVTAWKVSEAAVDLRALAKVAESAPDVRNAAIDGLAAFGDPESRNLLADLAASGQPASTRFRAASGIAQYDLAAGAKAAAPALASSKESDDIAPLVESFLQRKNGADALAGELEHVQMPADTAKRVLRAMYLAGRNDGKLSQVVSKLAGLAADPKPPTPDEVKKIQADVLAKGAAARGELVFRRSDLGCIKCHAIQKAGGNIGPELTAVGGSSPVDYIITSILDPNSSIKEQYVTRVINTGSGKTITGIVVDRNKDRVVLKDATGKLVRIPTFDIDEEATGRTLMPDGITKILTQQELLDLIRFVSELGKPGPYALRTNATIQKWKKLREVPAALREGIPNRDVIRDTVLTNGPEAWESAFSLFDGGMPLAELAKPNGNVVYLQGEINVVQAGVVEVQVDAPDSTAFWIDEELQEKPGKVTVNLTPGLHRITIRTVAGTGTLKTELRKAKDSTVQFEVVGGE